MPYYPKKRRAARKPRRSTKSKARKVSKPLRAAIKQVVKSQIETKTINCPDPTSGLLPTNTVNRAYNSFNGPLYLVQDVFRCPQGTADSTILGSPNRIGDRVKALGFKMNYYFHTANGFTLAGNKYQIPFVKLRIIVFTTAYGIPALTMPLLFDNNFLNVETHTLQPVNRDEGYVKTVLYDKTMLINNHSDFSVDNVSNPNQQLIYGSCLHFEKYIKFNHTIKYMDNNGTDPTGTDKPVYVAILAECDDSFSGGSIPPSDTPLVYITGYTQAYFKDA